MTTRKLDAFAPSRWAWKVRGITPTQKLVLLCIVSYYNAAQRVSFPSQSTIAAETGLSRRTVIRAINDLEELGLIHKQKLKRDSGEWWRTRYRLPELDPDSLLKSDGTPRAREVEAELYFDHEGKFAFEVNDED
jgi:pyocin large subunit-like protein